MGMCSISDSTSEPPAEACWLVRDGVVLASLVIPRNRRGRGRGLLGREGIEGAMLISPARSVHTVGMRFDIDVALLDVEHQVLKVMTMKRRRVSLPMRRCCSVLEAEAGVFRTWNLQPGDELEIRHASPGHQA